MRHSGTWGQEGTITVLCGLFYGLWEGPSCHQWPVTQYSQRHRDTEDTVLFCLTPMKAIKNQTLLFRLIFSHMSKSSQSHIFTELCSISFFGYNYQSCGNIWQADESWHRIHKSNLLCHINMAFMLLIFYISMSIYILLYGFLSFYIIEL